MFLENEPTAEQEIDGHLCSQAKERVGCSEKLLEEAKEKKLDSDMETIYTSSLKLVEQEVAGGNTGVALAYLKVYHLCQAIDFQLLAPMLSKTNLSELENLGNLSKSMEPNKSDYLQSLEALIEAEERDSNQIGEEKNGEGSYHIDRLGGF